jgi:hypothetical protein
MTVNKNELNISGNIPFIFNNDNKTDSISVPNSECMGCLGTHCLQLDYNKDNFNSITFKFNQNVPCLHNCCLLKNDSELLLLLEKLNDKGCLYYWVSNRKRYKKEIKLISAISFLKKVDDFFCNKGFSEFFPVKYPMSIYYYYSRYNRKNGVFRIIIYLLISFRLTPLLFKIQNPVRLLVFHKMPDSGLPQKQSSVK